MTIRFLAPRFLVPRLPLLRILLPKGLAARTALVMLASLIVVQVAGLLIHAMDRVDLQRMGQLHDAAIRAATLYRSVALSASPDRESAIDDFEAEGDALAVLAPDAPLAIMARPPMAQQRQMRADMQLVPIPQVQRPREMVFLGGPEERLLLIGMRLPDGDWLNVTLPMPPARPWDSPTFLVAIAITSLAAAGLTLWTVRRMIAPVTTLAAAAEHLGRDVNAPPLPEDGPTEVASASAAFNTMALRIRRYVEDRTFMLTAIGHDLRTPITRLKLRAEFMDDDEQRRKMLGDLDELESMVSATLAFGRDVAMNEAASAVDLAELVRTVLDETADARPEATDLLVYHGPDHLPVEVRPVAMKRAVVNLVQNALNYGGSVAVTLSRSDNESGPQVTMLVDDTGPGLPDSELESVFRPFYRLEASRNRETGGVGLGLPIVRNILLAHGGNVTLSNRATGGARATVILPA
jgi:signal transduction histidine kinase